MNLNKFFVLLLALISGIFVACSDSEVAGGSSDDAGIYAVKDLNVAGVSQKGPFATGSVVSVQGVDCKTLELTGEKFTGNVKSDKGDFAIDGVNLKSSCALFEVTGYYLNEVTGQKSSDPITLRTITNLKNRKSVNVNVLTSLEHERVKFLVTEKGTSFANAKKQADKEILALFGIADGVAESDEFEDLNIFEKGDGNAALLAISVLMQVSSDSGKNINVMNRLEKIGSSIARSGEWADDEMKAEMAEWANMLRTNEQRKNLSNNVKKWGYTDVNDRFMDYIDKFAELAQADKNKDSLENLSANSTADDNGLSIDWSIPKEAHFNPDVEYDSIVDSRDGQVYRIVQIGKQIWMAENLNYADSVQTPSLLGRNWCHENKLERCSVAGRLYTWSAAIDSVKLANDSDASQFCGYLKNCSLPVETQGICPEGWHLPDTSEWRGLFNWVYDEMVQAGKAISSNVGLYEEDKGPDNYGFSAFPVGGVDPSINHFNDDNRTFYFWSLSESQRDKQLAYVVVSYLGNVGFADYFKRSGYSIRCVKNGSVASARVSLPACKTDTEDNCEYGTLTDSRDGQVYKTVKIGDQTWMAENLNYADSILTPSLLKRSWCYDNKAENCESRGRLYTWTAAIDSLKQTTDATNSRNCGYGLTCGLFEKVQGICPEGWHLPDTTDWRTLVMSVGGWSGAGELLKSQTDWLYFKGTDSYGFSAFPGGFRYLSGTFNDAGGGGYFWASTEKSEESARQAYSICMANNDIETYSDGFKDNAYSVRCIKD